MFASTKAFSGFAVDDLEQARRFYGETLAWFTDPAGNILAVLQDRWAAATSVAGRPGPERRSPGPGRRPGSAGVSP
jgi:hypothetical protein